jgi:hypothetical protein
MQWQGLDGLFWLGHDWQTLKSSFNMYVGILIEARNVVRAISQQLPFQKRPLFQVAVDISSSDVFQFFTYLYREKEMR